MGIMSAWFRRPPQSVEALRSHASTMYAGALTVAVLWMVYLLSGIVTMWHESASPAYVATACAFTLCACIIFSRAVDARRAYWQAHDLAQGAAGPAAVSSPRARDGAESGIKE